MTELHRSAMNGCSFTWRLHRNGQLRWPTPATNEVNDLKLVALFERCGFPLRAWNNLQVQLYGNTVRLHAKLGHERCYREAVRKVALFAIDVEDHKSN